MAKAALLPAVLLAVACAAPDSPHDSATPVEEPKEQPARAEAVVVPSGWPPSVVAVRGDRVAISAGSVDKVRVGDCFNLSRGRRYVGRISITEVDRNLAVGVFDTAHAGGAAPPEAGDRAFPCGPY